MAPVKSAPLSFGIERGKPQLNALRCPSEFNGVKMPGGVDGLREEQLFALAYEDFCRNLERLRTIVPVSTVCMHGSPLSGIDNLDLLRKYDYKSLGLVAEPYLDVDFDEMFYLTDTGRRWDGWKVSVRDKMPQQEEWVREGLVFHSTWDIIRAVEVPDVRGPRSEVGGKTAGWLDGSLRDGWLDGWRSGWEVSG